MGKSTDTANALLNLIFQGTTWPGMAQNVAGSPVGNLWAALHTADPGPGGNQSSNEITYAGYARVAVPRSGVGWTTAAAGSVSPQSAITFPIGSGGAGDAAFWSIGLASSGAGEILYSGPITPVIPTGNAIAPQLSLGTTVTEA